MKPEYSHLSYETGVMLQMADEEKELRMKTELRDWLNAQLAKSEQSVKNRVESAAVSRSGTDAEWREAAAMSGTLFRSKKQRLQDADREDLIVVKCRNDVQMWKTVIAMLEEKDLKTS
jgi:hypothetical protein